MTTLRLNLKGVITLGWWSFFKMVCSLSRCLDSFELQATIFSTTVWPFQPQVYIQDPAPLETKFNFVTLSSIYDNLIIMVSYTGKAQQSYFILMNKKTHRRPIETPEINKISHGLNKIEQTVTFEESLCGKQSCDCLVCQPKKQFMMSKKGQNFDQISTESDSWLLKILNGLCSRDALSLKIYIPDICFMDGDMLKVFHTDTRDSRIKKVEGTTPAKNIYFTMLKLKKQYKQMLEQKFQKSILNQINPQFVHEKYMQHILPSFFNDSEDSVRLQTNKLKFMKYVLHKDKQLLIQSIEEHKINENEPFCTIRYKDGNMQLFSKRQFQNYTLMKMSPEVVYVQSYIKQKQQQKANFTSEYSFMSNTDMKLFNRAEKQVLVLIGGIGKYSQAYEDIEVLQDATIQLMRSDIEAYIKYMTYKIVHYLAMVSRIYVKHIKINWVLNDLEMVYIQNVFEFQTTQLCLRALKYRLPPKEENVVFYKDSENFISLYKQIQMMRQAKRVKIRNSIIKQKQQKSLKFSQKTEISTIDNTQQSIKLSQLRTARKQKLSIKKNSKTISAVAYRLTQSPPRIKKSNNEEKDKGKVSLFERKRRERYMSVLEKYVL